MSVATGTAIAIGATAAAGVAGSAIAGHEQASATDKATAAQKDSAANTLAFNQRVYDTNLANEQPFLNLGNQATAAISGRLADGSLSNYPGGAFSFTPADWQKDPAFGWQEQQGEQAIQRSAAAGGGLVSGGVLKDLAQYSQGLASSNYQQQYGNALSAYQMAYQQFQDSNSRLFGAAAIGQNAAAQAAGAGESAAGTVANVNTNTSNSLSNLYTSQGNAGAAATLAATNSIQGAGNSALNYFAQQQQQMGSSYNPSVMMPYSPTYPINRKTGI